MIVSIDNRSKIDCPWSSFFPFTEGFQAGIGYSSIMVNLAFFGGLDLMISYLPSNSLIKSTGEDKNTLYEVEDLTYVPLFRVRGIDR